MKIYKYEFKNGAFIRCGNIDCIEFACKHKEIFIYFGSSSMRNSCNIHVSNGKCFFLSLFELNENQLIKAASELERYYLNILNNSFKS